MSARCFAKVLNLSKSLIYNFFSNQFLFISANLTNWWEILFKKRPNICWQALSYRGRIHIFTPQNLRLVFRRVGRVVWARSSSAFGWECGGLEKLKCKLVFFGELAEWLNAAVLKTVKDASPSGVRIPDSPPKF